MSNFVNLYLDKKIPLESIHDYVEKWHNGQSNVQLHEYLGMTRAEYGLWVMDESCLERLLSLRQLSTPAQKIAQGLLEALEHVKTHG